MSHKKSRGRCPFPKCRRRDEHDGDHSPQIKRKSGVRKLRGGLDPAIGKATQFQPGQSGNPGGRPKHDFAGELARAIFEKNGPAIEKAYLKLLKRGSLGAFQVLSERGYGKIPQPVVGGGEGSDPIVVKVDC